MCPRYDAVFSALYSFVSLWHTHTNTQSEAVSIREHQNDSNVTHAEHYDKRRCPEGKLCPRESRWHILTDTLSRSCINVHFSTHVNQHVRTYTHLHTVTMCLPQKDTRTQKNMFSFTHSEIQRQNTTTHTGHCYHIHTSSGIIRHTHICTHTHTHTQTHTKTNTRNDASPWWVTEPVQ